MTMTDPDLRFNVPLYSLAEAARYLAVPTTTFTSWAKGYVRHYPDRPPVTGAPVLTGGAKVSDVIDRFQAGESLHDVAADFGVLIEDIEDALRVASRQAA